MVNEYKDPLEEPGALENIFGFHPATEDTAKRHSTVRQEILRVADKFLQILPKSPERTIAINQKLRDAMMWANAAIAVHGDAPVAEDDSKPHAYYQSEKYREEQDEK